MRSASSDPLLERRFFTVAEIARITRLSKMTVYRAVHSGELTSIRIGRSFRIPEVSARRWLDHGEEWPLTERTS